MRWSDRRARARARAVRAGLVLAGVASAGAVVHGVAPASAVAHGVASAGAVVPGLPPAGAVVLGLAPTPAAAAGPVPGRPVSARAVPGPTVHREPAAARAREEPAARAQEEPVVVGSKPFGESYLLAEMFAQLLESRGIAVDRRLGLGATELTFQALRTGQIDVYPEYTGTGLLALLGEAPSGSADDVFRRVSDVFAERWGLLWLPPLGFENTYAVAVRRETAERYDLATLSDLARAGPELVAGLSPDFIGRADGLPGLREAYGMRFADVRSLLQAVKYEALAAGRVDVIDGYSTDGAVARYDLVVLTDDRGFFPPYDAAPLVSDEMGSRNPLAISILASMAGRFDAATMRELNRRIEMDGEPLERVARAALVDAGLVAGDGAVPGGGAAGERGDGAAEAGDPTGEGGATGASGDPAAEPAGARDGLLAYLWARRGRLAGLTGRHLLLAGGSLLAAILLAVPLGLVLERGRGMAEPVIRAVGLFQTVPSIALLAFMIPLLGIGVVPAMVALFLYSLFPILRNTYTGVRDADPVAVEAARSLGMTAGQLLRHVRLPLAAPVIMAGIRTAAVINIGTATLAAFIGAGGLGDPIVSGLALSDVRMILSGAIPAAALALVVDLALHAAEGWVTPRGLEVGDRSG